MPFSKEVRYSKILEDWAEVPNIEYINRNDHMADKTFLITAKLIARPRMKEDEDVLSIYNFGYEHEGSFINHIETLTTNMMNCSKIIFFEIENESIEAYVPPEGCDELEDIEFYLNTQSIASKKNRLRIFVNNSKRYTIVIQNTIYAENMHIFSGYIARLLPWLFEDKPLDNLEKEYLNALGGDSVSYYIEKLEKLINRDNYFYKMYLNASLKDFNKVVKDLQKKKVTEQIRRLNEEIEKNKQALVSMYHSKNELNFKYSAINSSNPEGNALLEYFCNDNTLKLDNIDVSAGAIQFKVLSTLSQWDDEVLETMINDEWSIINGDSPEWDPDDLTPEARNYTEEEYRREFFNMLLRNEIKIRVSALYTLYINDYIVRGSDGATETYIGNPHLKFYNCLGEYEYKINECLSQNRVIDAIQLCQMSASSINVAENATMNRFIEDIFNNSVENKIIEYKGEIISPAELTNYMNID